MPVHVNVGNVQGPKILTSTGQKGQIQVVLPATAPTTVNNNYYGTTISGFCGNSGPISITAGLNVNTNNNAAPQRQISGFKSLAKKAAVLDDEVDFVSTTPAVQKVYEKALGDCRKEDKEQFTQEDLLAYSKAFDGLTSASADRTEDGREKAPLSGNAAYEYIQVKLRGPSESTLRLFVRQQCQTAG